MKWTEVTVYTTEEGLDAVCARFDTLGITQVSIDEDRESIKAFLDENAKYWDYADMDAITPKEPCVRAYLSDTGSAEAKLRDIRDSFAALSKEDVGIDLGSLRIETRDMADEDWANNWKAYYKPIPVGKRLLVRPSWENVENTENRVILSLDPGMAFGSGSHQTTRMCLEYIEEHLTDGQAVLDLGCGSGILSIAAMLLGASHVTMVDIDPVTDTVVRENIAMNGIDASRYDLFIGDVLKDAALNAKLAEHKYDIVVANIVASVIIPLAPIAAKLVNEGGLFVTSGIISDRADEVDAAIRAAGFTVLERKTRDDWVAILAKRQP